MIVVEGKCGIKATVLAHSVSPQGIEMITFEIEYPRLILAELNTHRDKSRNSFSSRAVPFEKMIQQLTGRPVRFGANQAGMQDKGEDFKAAVKYKKSLLNGVPEDMSMDVFSAWEWAKQNAICHAKALYEAGYHKQVYNRLLEPFQMMKTVISGTEWANFWWLRDDEAADPTIAELARCMREAQRKSKPFLLHAGEWHLPYIDMNIAIMPDGSREQIFTIDEHFILKGENKLLPHLTLEQAIKISCARCAAVSYRNEGYGLEKSLEVYDRLVGSEKKHASAFEHCATPMATRQGMPMSICGRVNLPFSPGTWEEGISHVDRKGNLWSGNLKGWIQYRKLIKGENYEGEEIA
jgi:thymidylate synthase ThyX